jgi:hypothetical protein
MSLPELLDQLESEFLRKILKDGKRVTYITGVMDKHNVIDPRYNDLYPAIEFNWCDCRTVFIHKGDRFMVDIDGSLSSEFSYDHTEGEMKMLFSAIYGPLSYEMGNSVTIRDFSLVMGGIVEGEIPTLCVDRIAIYNYRNFSHPLGELISAPNFETDYLYSFESVPAYMDKVELAARRVFGHVNKSDINQDHWLEFDRLMRDRSIVKSARSVVKL